jgi:hypothetical protein
VKHSSVFQTALNAVPLLFPCLSVRLKALEGAYHPRFHCKGFVCFCAFVITDSQCSLSDILLMGQHLRFTLQRRGHRVYQSLPSHLSVHGGVSAPEGLQVVDKEAPSALHPELVPSSAW